MAYTDQELAKIIAFISMLLSYVEFEWASSADRIGDVENIARCLRRCWNMWDNLRPYDLLHLYGSAALRDF